MKKSVPLRFALRFLQWFCPPELYEGIEGDLTEQYEEDKNELGEKRAGIRFIWSVSKFFRPGIFLRNKISMQFDTSMIHNYIKIAVRNIAKRKLYAFINTFGLSIGIAFCMLVYLFIQDERSFDQFHENKHAIYRLHTTSFSPIAFEKGEKEPYGSHANLPAKLGEVMLDELAEVESMTRFFKTEGVIRYADKIARENKIVYADSGFFNMFSFPFLAGSKKNLFKKNTDAVLTESFAKQYFGNEDPIGKTFTFDNVPFTVAGIIQSPPENSSLEFDMLLPLEGKPYFAMAKESWGGFSYPTFVQLHPGTELQSFKSHLDELTVKYMSDLEKKWREWGNIPAQYKTIEFNFMQLSEIHMANDIVWDKVSDKQYTWILGGIAGLILVIACINYVSLALTTSGARRIEIGIRKVVGAQRKQLVYQFGMESFVLVILSILLGSGLILLFLPTFNQFTGKSIQLTKENLFVFSGITCVMMIVVGLLAGSYPAFFLSRFKPAAVLKGKFTGKVKTAFVQPLVAFQFFISAALISCSLIMFYQMEYITTKDLGYNKEQTIAITINAGWNAEADRSVELFRNYVKDNPDIKRVAATGAYSTELIGQSATGYQVNGENKFTFRYRVDENYIPLLGIELIKGRKFDESIISDNKAVIVNEALVKDLGWDDPLNEYFNYREDTTGPGYKVIGVVKDFHFLSLENEIRPLFLSIDKKDLGYFQTMLVKISENNIPKSLESIRKTWKELFPDRPFDYSFIDQDVARQYESYTRWTSITSLSTVFAIVIACLGLFGLAGINVVNRAKEIGIRKTMGARLNDIFVLLNRQYVTLAIAAFVVSIPVSWYAMNKWLSSFQYKIEIGWELFAVSMLSSLAVALITVSYHGIKAALINPADTLKYE